MVGTQVQRIKPLGRESTKHPGHKSLQFPSFSLKPPGSMSISERDVVIRNTAQLFILKEYSILCSRRLLLSFEIGQITVMMAYRTHMDWDSLPPQCMLRISIRYSCQLPPPLHPQFNINLLQHIILLPPPQHLASYHCPIVIHCLRSTQEDQCPITANTQSIKACQSCV